MTALQAGTRRFDSEPRHLAHGLACPRPETHLIAQDAIEDPRRMRTLRRKTDREVGSICGLGDASRERRRAHGLQRGCSRLFCLHVPTESGYVLAFCWRTQHLLTRRRHGFSSPMDRHGAVSGNVWRDHCRERPCPTTSRVSG